MILATKTLTAIEQALQNDQGARYRFFLEKTLPLAKDAYNPEEDDWRDHLGASLIGRECSRELWYSFHWSTLKRFDGRMLRLFNRGHLEEARFVALLLMIDCAVWQVTAEGKQFRVDGHKGHFGGSLDGVIRGLPDLPDEAVLAEFKTHNDKSFAKLVSDGVMAAKWEHFVQMQIYMGKNSLRWALYGAVNKNDDMLHLELVQFDASTYQRYLDRSEMIIDAIDPPPRISTTPGFYKCKFCDHAQLCHQLPGYKIALTCRTCLYSSICNDGKWQCQQTMPPESLSSEKQRVGCEKYQLNPVVTINKP